MAYEAKRARPFRNYKEAEEVYRRALKIAEHIRGDELTPGEKAAMYEGFMANLRPFEGDVPEMEGWQTEWELLAEACRAALDGKDLVTDRAGRVSLEKVKKGQTFSAKARGEDTPD